MVAPEPVFRRLTNAVDVGYRYDGPRGSIAVGATLTAGNGWRATVPLARAVTFSTRRYDGHVTLNLNSLDARARAAAKVIGAQTGPLTVTVEPTVTSADGTRFAPSTQFTLSPLALTSALTGRHATVTSHSTAQQRHLVPAVLHVLGHRLLVQTARYISVAVLLLSLLVAAVLTAAAAHRRTSSEGAAIRRRYATLLVPVTPMPTPAGRPVIDVRDFATLARLAERYGLLVLHWTRSNLDTFIVQDDATTYRYRTAAIDAPTMSGGEGENGAARAAFRETVAADQPPR